MKCSSAGSIVIPLRVCQDSVSVMQLYGLQDFFQIVQCPYCAFYKIMKNTAHFLTQYLGPHFAVPTFLGPHLFKPMFFDPHFWVLIIWALIL